MEVGVKVDAERLQEVLDFIPKHFGIVLVEQVEKLSDGSFLVTFITALPMREVVRILKENEMLDSLELMRPMLW